MAKAAGNVLFTGTISDLSAYRMKGVDRIILRSKAVISRSRMKNHPNYELTRRNNEEWKACIAAGKNIRMALYAVSTWRIIIFPGICMPAAKTYNWMIL